MSIATAQARVSALPIRRDDVLRKWLPLVLIVTLLPLRAVKGLLIALQYHHKAAEGRLERRGDE